VAKTKQKHNNVQRRLAHKKARDSARSRRKHTHASVSFHSLPLAFCRLSAGWRDDGIALVYVARRLGEGRITSAFFYVDVWGVGIRDCYITPHERPSDAYAWLEAAGERFETSFEECSEELGSQLIWGGLWYGKEAGFLPPREFHDCKKFIPRVPDDAWDRSLFGKGGERLVIGEMRDLLKRSKGMYNPDTTEGHFLIGGPVDEVDETSPWDELLVEDEGLPEGTESLLFIKGEYRLADFHEAFDLLSGWEDLGLVRAATAERFAEFDWTRAYPPNHWNPMSRMPGARQNLGRLTLEDGTLTVEVRGKSWILIMDSRLHDALGTSITRGRLEIHDPMDLITDPNSVEQGQRGLSEV